MSLSQRLVLIVSASIGVAIVGASVAMGLLSRTALIDQAETQAQLLAGLIAAEANRSALLAGEIDQAAMLELETQAIAIAHLAEAFAADPEALATHLGEITAKGTIDDIWLLDSEGEPILRIIGGIGGGGENTAQAGFDARELEVLLSGRRFSIDLRSIPPGEWERPLRYVGVRAGEDRFVLAGGLEDEIDILLDAIGLTGALDSFAGQPGIKAIWVLDDLLHLAAAVALDEAGRAMKEPPLAEDDRALARRVLETGATSFLGEQALHVAAPILDRGGVAIGAAVIHTPRDQLDLLLIDHVVFGLIVAAVAFLIGSLIAVLSARHIVRPVMALTRAAEEMDRRRFEPASLDRVADRGDELGTLVHVFQAMAREVQAREDHLEGLVRERTLDLEQKNEQLEQARQRMEAELGIAHSLQGAILPKTMPEHSAYSGRALMTPAWEMGGDFYDCFTLPDGRLGVVIADVAGKGVPAAFFMAIARTVTRAAAHDHQKAGACLREVNDAICAQNPHHLFVTLFYGILDPATGRFDFANAGHNAPFLIGADGGVEPLPMTGGVAIGVMPGLAYDEKAMDLAGGDTLFLYTDGISEAMNEQGDMFEEARVASVLATGHEVPVNAVIDNVTVALSAFVGGASQSDDITCLVLRYHGPPA